MKQPIGVFDSGVGGLSVWREVVKQLPFENIIYYSDNAHCPYGPKSQDEVIALAEKIVQFFLSMQAKMVIVACNTATAAAIDYLRANYSIPFVGMEPAVKPAAMHTHTGCVGILATAGTLGGKLFNTTKERYAANVKVILQVGTGLVELEENGEQHSDRAKELLELYVRPMVDQGADHIVLGCTHYPFFRPLIDEIAGENVRIIDPAPAVARRAKELLTKNGLLEASKQEPRYEFYSSGNTLTLTTLLQSTLRMELSTLKIEEYKDL